MCADVSGVRRVWDGMHGREELGNARASGAQDSDKSASCYVRDAINSVSGQWVCKAQTHSRVAVE
jgi:hypothetical protein